MGWRRGAVAVCSAHLAVDLSGGGRTGRGGAVLEGEDAVPESLFVLDLAAEPARTEFELPKMRSDIGGEVPKLIEEGDVVAVFLGLGRRGVGS